MSDFESLGEVAKILNVSLRNHNHLSDSSSNELSSFLLSRLQLIKIIDLSTLMHPFIPTGYYLMIGNTYVTAAVSGTECSGELAASDLMVTCMFVVALG